MPPILYYIRHGETDWNVEGRLQGQRDIPLNARGRVQALRCGEILRDLMARDRQDPAGFDFVCSPFLRARETIERVRPALGLEPSGYRIEPQLAELSFGHWEGFTYPELRSREAATLAARDRDRWGFAPPGGESYAGLVKRMAAWYATHERDTVVVAHGGTLRALMVVTGVASQETALTADVEQGVVYQFTAEQRLRYA